MNRKLYLALILAGGIVVAVGIARGGAVGTQLGGPRNSGEMIYGAEIAALQEEVRGLWKELREQHRDAKEGWDLAVKGYRMLAKGAGSM